MSWFYYGNIENHKIRRGVWLRYDSNPDVIQLIKKCGNKRYFDGIQKIVVKEYYKEENTIILEVWCKNIIDIFRRKPRYNVFRIPTTPNPKWVCEGDLGKGLRNN